MIDKEIQDLIELAKGSKEVSLTKKQEYKGNAQFREVYEFIKKLGLRGGKNRVIPSVIYECYIYVTPNTGVDKNSFFQHLTKIFTKYVMPGSDKNNYLLNMDATKMMKKAEKYNAAKQEENKEIKQQISSTESET